MHYDENSTYSFDGPCIQILTHMNTSEFESDYGYW
jgi:hypothetical protein